MLQNLQLSLSDLLGKDYLTGVIQAQSALTGRAESALWKIADQKVSFCPLSFLRRQEALMGRTGQSLIPAFNDSCPGAATDSYAAAQHDGLAPLAGYGCFRIGEDGRLYYAGKSEHYHIPLGHGFPGYQLVEHAKALGIPNATHNNTRGFITRRTERALVAAANGVSPQAPQMDELLAKREPGVLNRVINLETGSLAVEAALKMMLSRFYSIDNSPAPYTGRIPVFLVMADNAGGVSAGYHGTTVLAQTLRGLWPQYLKKAQDAGLYRVVGVPLGDIKAFRKAMETYNAPPYKTAGFCHEIVMMNYGGIRQKETYLKAAYALCHTYDTPVLCDEIQSCAWNGDLFLFRRYGLTPDFVSVGKGFPGGCYPASRILCSGAYDSLNQFGALVTNGQEELASLCYLITMAFVSANGKELDRVGRAYQKALTALQKAHPALIAGREGEAHMGALCFTSVDTAVAFCRRMQHTHGVDISAQTYKPNCPPAALTKLPLLTTRVMVAKLASYMEETLRYLEEEHHGA